MKRSYDLVNNSSAATETASAPKRRAMKVCNSLEPMAFAWPAALLSDQDQHQHQEQHTTATTLLDHLDVEFSRFTDDSAGFCSEGSSLSGEGDSDDLLDLLTEDDWLLSEGEDAFLGLPSLDPPQQQQGQGQEDHMDQECVDYFMTEYLKVVKSSTCEHISFSDFVTVSLEMIALYKKDTVAVPTASAPAASPQQAGHSNSNHNASSSFDFSIQNWQQRVVATQKAAPPLTHAHSYHHHHHYQTAGSSSRGGGGDGFPLLCEEDLQMLQACGYSCY